VNVRNQVFLWAAQRYSAMVLALCVVVHLVVIIYAVRNGLSADEILGRTRGSIGWACFYTLFLGAAAVHAPIGLRSIFSEWVGWRGRSLDIAVLVIAALLVLWGARGIWAVIA